MNSKLYAVLDGQEILQYTLKKGSMEADIITYGGTITAIRVPDKNGNMTDVAYGYKTVRDYLDHTQYMGALIGRFGNRIESGTFLIDGKAYKVGCNEGENSLHGGMKGFDKRIWNAKAVGDDTLVLTYHSPDGEEGFPANLDVKVTYSLTEDMGFSIRYEAVSDGDTPINLTNHAYFNVHGTEHTTDGLTLRIDADRITPVDEKLIPHNEFMIVDGNLYDFRTARPFICDLSGNQVLQKRGCYDENFALNGMGLRNVASLSSSKTGITMDVITDQPGMQIYTGFQYGIALETQNFPNAVNCPDYPSAILRAGEKYETTTIYRFSVKD